MIAVLAAAALSTVKFLVAMVPVFSVGVIVAEFIVALGWVNKIAWITRPLTRIGHLKPECGASFLTAFLSPSAGNAMLVRHHEAGLITRKELIIAAIVNTFPGIVMHWRTVLPIAIPLIGIYAFIYYGFLVLVGLLKTIAALFAGHFLLEPDNAYANIPSAEKQENASPSWALWVESVKKSRKIIIRVIKTTIPVTAVMFVLIHAGMFDYLNTWLSGHTAFLPLSPKALSIVATRLASNVGAFTVAGNLLYASKLSGREVVLSLLVGNFLASGINLRFLIPYYLGIFGPGTGWQVLAVSTVLRMVIMAALIWTLFVIWT
ncbi:hypothetical protein [uncultured Desulfobacter sp.]|uniref:hypothetical protein n=1 Tax=uncultured Desulfobacter sp. TaxID=240139 RepID=UPI0029F4C97C|nr:hypothetical protein [uncultured Desulfobacter sp.]